MKKMTIRQWLEVLKDKVLSQKHEKEKGEGKYVDWPIVRGGHKFLEHRK